MTASELKLRTRKQLVVLAKRHRVSGWCSMRKDELIRAVLAASRAGKPKPRRNGTASRSSGSNGRLSSAGKPGRNGHANNTTSHSLLATHTTDLLEARACDRYWLQVQWEVSHRMVARAEAALKTEWHQSHPVIRLFDVTGDEGRATSRTHVRDVPINGDAHNWFIQIDDPCHSYKLVIGYLAPSGRFYTMARSKVVRTSRLGSDELPANASGPVVDIGRTGPFNGSNGHHGNGHGTFVPSKLAHGLPRFVNGARNGSNGLGLKLDADMIVYGATDPRAQLTLLGVDVPLEKDGTFALRFQVPNGRQVIPAVATIANGIEQRTVILAIERNTKELEPHLLDESEL